MSDGNTPDPHIPQAATTESEEASRLARTLELHDKFYYHPPSEQGVKRHQRLSSEFEELAAICVQTCPRGRELALALTKLEEAKFWASAAVARNPVTR